MNRIINGGSIDLTLTDADTGARLTSTLPCHIVRDDPYADPEFRDYAFPDVVRIGQGEYPWQQVVATFAPIADINQVCDILETVEYAINDGGQDTGHRTLDECEDEDGIPSTFVVAWTFHAPAFRIV